MGESDLDSLDPFSRGSEPELELDLPAPPTRQEPVKAQARPVPNAAAGPMAHEDEVDLPEQTPRRALELANHFGKPSIFLEIPYAIGVIRRNRALREKLPTLRRVRDAAEVDLAAATLELGRALHANGDHPRAKEIGTPLRIANARHRTLTEQQADLRAAREGAQEKTATLEATIARCEELAGPFNKRARELQLQIVVFQKDFEAVSGAIHEATEELEAIEKSKEPDANRRIELEAMRTNRRPEAAAALAEIEARTPELGQLEAKIAEIIKGSAKAKAEIESIAASLAKTKKRVDLESKEAKELFEKALVDLADKAVDLRLDYAIAKPAAKLARLRYDTHLAHVRELEMHELALTLYYPTSLRRGFFTLGLLTCGALGWIVYQIAS